MNEYIKSDLYRYYGDASFKTFLLAYFMNKTFRFQVALRLWQTKGFWGFVGKFLYKINRNENLQIPPNTKIGYGLYIGHNGPVVIHHTTVIGNNCNLSQFTTIGSNKGMAAVIGDNVYVGPNVCIIENVKIGNNVTIGAGSVVTKDIPDNATAVGNYAKCISFDNPARFINNMWNKN